MAFLDTFFEKFLNSKIQNPKFINGGGQNKRGTPVIFGKNVHGPPPNYYGPESMLIKKKHVAYYKWEK